MAEDELPVGIDTKPQRARFRGDAGRGADVRLEDVSRNDMAPGDGVLMEIQPKDAPAMPTVPNYTPPMVQKTSLPAGVSEAGGLPPGVSELPAGVSEVKSQPKGSWFQEYVSKPVTAAVKAGGQYTPVDAAQAAASKLTGGAVPMPTPTAKDSTAETLAKLVVPQSATEAGVMAGTLGGGALASKLAVPAVTAASRLVAPGLRIAGATAGGAAGGGVSGEGAGKGALQGAASSGFGEGASTAAGKLVRSLPGMASRISNETSQAIAGTIGKQIPSLAKYGDDLHQMASAGRKELSGMFESALLDAGKITGPIQVSFSKSPISVTGAHELLDGMPAKAKAFAKDEIAAAIKAADPSGAASDLWYKAMGEYKSGINVLKVLGKKHLWDGDNFRVDRFQQDLAIPDTVHKLTTKMGGGFNDLVESATRGGGIGAKDKIISMAPTSLRGWIPSTVFGSAGAAAGGPVGGVLAAIAPWLTPGILSRWAGRTPYAVNGAGRVAADLATNKAIEQANGR